MTIIELCAGMERTNSVTMMETVSVFSVAYGALAELSYESKVKVYYPIVTLDVSIVTVAEDLPFAIVTNFSN